MKKRNNNRGFSMAELLAVVAIIMALAAVAFIYVQRQQRSMTRLEFDSIAKEVFIAAQNHLTMAESQGYLDESIQYGELDDQIPENDKKKVYFLVINGGKTSYGEAANLLLPYGAVDGNVLLGSILISYQPSTARVLDVFYSKPANGTALTLNGTAFDGSKEEYKTLMGSYRDDDSGSKAARRQDYNGKVIGWYGDGDALPVGERLETPEIVVHNEEKLWVEVKDKNASKSSAALQLTITGETSGAKKAITLRENGTPQESALVKYISSDASNPHFTVVLDDITVSGQHFADLKADNKDKSGNELKFIPGENVVLEAVAYNNSALTNIAYSGKNTTNSLFAEVQKRLKTGSTPEYEYVALIANFRHFENLDNTLSGFEFNKSFKKDTSTESNPQYETISKAEQMQNMVWTGTISETEKPFIQRIQTLNNLETNDVSIYLKGSPASAATTANCLYPVSITTENYILSYDGLNHSMSSVKIQYAGPAGAFGTISTNGSAVSNLELIDFDIKDPSGDTKTNNAGALVGSAANVTISNVLARNSIVTKTENGVTTSTESRTDNIVVSGNAGGLIGSMSGGTVEKSAAALYVKSTGMNSSAGGLIGKAESSAEVTASYSGGHTYSGKPDYTGATAPTTPRNSKEAFPARYYGPDNKPMYNVLCADGDNNPTGIVGGLIGNAGNTTISYSYSTCSAFGATAGGLIGTGTGDITNCYCTGLVDGTTVGAFAGTKDVNIASGKTSYYFEIVNEIRNKDKDNKLTSGYTYLAPLPETDSYTGIQGFDKENATMTAVQVYNFFTGGTWQKAYPYDSKLGDYYQDTYNLRTVEQLGAVLQTAPEDKTVYFVKDHYGDWPAPEEFIFVS